MIEWRCRNGHVLGLVMRYGHYNCLLLLDPRDEIPAIFATISGQADVTCRVCGDRRLWRFGGDLLERLQRRFATA